MKAIHFIFIFFIWFFLAWCANDTNINNSNSKSSIISNNTNLTNWLIDNSLSIVNSWNVFSEITIISLWTWSYKLSWNLNWHFKKISVVWEFDKKKDSPYVLSKYNSGSNYFEYFIRPEFNAIKKWTNLYIFTWEKQDWVIETKEVVIEEKNFNPDNVIYNNLINPKEIKTINWFNLIKSSESPNKQYKYELYSKGNECWCYAYACILNIKEISNKKILKQYTTKHDWPCDLFLWRFGDVLKWKDDTKLVVYFWFSDWPGAIWNFEEFSLNKDKIDKSLFSLHQSQFWASYINNITFNNNHYVLTSTDSWAIMYESKYNALKNNNSISRSDFFEKAISESDNNAWYIIDSDILIKTSSISATWAWVINWELLKYDWIYIDTFNWKFKYDINKKVIVKY